MVYLLHFSKPYKHAAHYIGYCHDDRLIERLAEHDAGRGARLIKVIKDAGLSFACVRTWPGGRQEERQLKRRHSGARLCPVCRSGDQQTEIAIDLSAIEAIAY